MDVCEECGDDETPFVTEDGRALCTDCLEATGYAGDVVIRDL